MRYSPLNNWRINCTFLGSDVEGVASKLRETQDLLEAVEAEKESAEAQVMWKTHRKLYIW